MQTKVLAALSALFFIPVEAAILPRATITPGTLIPPEVSFNPSQEVDPRYTAIKLVQADLQKLTILFGDLNHPNGPTIKDSTDQVSAVTRQATTNAVSTLTRAGTIAGALKGITPDSDIAPNATSTGPLAAPTTGLIGAIQELIGQGQALARTASTQLNTLKNQGDAVADPDGKAAYALSYTQAHLSFKNVIHTVVSAVSLVLDTVANNITNYDLAQRVRVSELKFASVCNLNPELVDIPLN